MSPSLLADVRELAAAARELDRRLARLEAPPLPREHRPALVSPTERPTP